MMNKEQASEIIDGFGWCGCGDPEAALEVVKQFLLYYSLKWEDAITWEERDEELTRLVPSEGAQYIILYLLDHAGLLEHGGNVTGSWLTQKGYAFLGYLLVSNYYEDED